MRIAYIVPALTQAGNVCVVKDLATVFMHHGHECVVYYFDYGENEYVFPCETKHITFGEAIPFNDYDIVHTHSLRPDIYAFFKKPIRCRAKLVCTIHNYVFEDLISDYGRFKGYLAGLLWQLCRIRNKRLLVLSKAHYKYYTKWFGRKKLRVAYNTRVLDKSKDISADDKRFFTDLHSKFKFICASICRVTGRKGLDQIVDALPNIEKDIAYVVIGEGAGLQEIKDRARENKVEDRVFFLGNREDGYRFMPYIDLFCIPSHSEGFPLAMLEAACYGKAILSSDLPVFKEVFDENEVVICRENDIESVSKGILKAMSNKEGYGQAAQKKFEKDYSPESFYENHLKIYKELL